MLKLRLLTGPRAGRQLRVSDTKPVSIGRRKGRLRLHDSRVSKDHAEIAYANGVWTLRDLGSANGTFVNRQKASGLVELEPGDLVQMGRVLIKVVRCDGIGMDTLAGPQVDDGDSSSGLNELEIDNALANDDFDLDALLSNDESPDQDFDNNDDSDIYPAIPQEQATQSKNTNDYHVEDIEHEAVAVAFEDPVDEDDDSFFSDLGEATDKSDGVNLAVSENEAEEFTGPQTDDESDEDPFLSGDTPDDNNDLITLDDELSKGPRSAGTTLLTTADDSSASPAIESETHADHDDIEDEDDLAPAIVGLHLDHAPPQQPDEIDDELDTEPDTVPAEQSDMLSEVTDDEPHGFTATDDDLPSADEVSSTVSSASFDDLENASALFDHDDDTQSAEIEADTPPQAPPPVLIDHSTTDATQASEQPDIDSDESSLPHWPDNTFELDTADLSAELPEEAPLAQASLNDTAQTPSDEELTSEQAEPIDTAPELEPLPPGAPEFDIDAAFDALSEGLDDSFELPAIGSEIELHATEQTDAPSTPTDSDPAQATPTDDSKNAEHDPLIGSQLDVNFIKDALSKLEPADLEDELSNDQKPVSPPNNFLQTPPPGLNPTTINPPDEPGRSTPPRNRRSGNGKWFLSIFFFMIIGGVAGVLITQNLDKLVTGRTSTNAPSLPGSQPTTPKTPTTQNPPSPVAQTPSTETTDTPGQDNPQAPNPFNAGPTVLGPQALQGLTRSNEPATPANTPALPATTQPTTPNTTPQTVNQDPTADDTTDPGKITTVQPTDTNTPPPVVEQTPARIVFLVDASGSLVDSLPQMLVWLNEALQTIQSNETFAVYFFKADKPIAIKPEGLITPTREILQQLRENELNPNNAPIFPSGRSNPTQAIAQALKLNPTDLYFLSDDAFAMHQGDTNPLQAIELVKQALQNKDVRVHGVQFFYKSNNSVLETLANQYNGTFEFVRERVIPDSDPIDLLQELGSDSAE